MKQRHSIIQNQKCSLSYQKSCAHTKGKFYNDLSNYSIIMAGELSILILIYHLSKSRHHGPISVPNRLHSTSLLDTVVALQFLVNLYFHIWHKLYFTIAGLSNWWYSMRAMTSIWRTKDHIGKTLACTCNFLTEYIKYSECLN